MCMQNKQLHWLLTCLQGGAVWLLLTGLLLFSRPTIRPIASASGVSATKIEATDGVQTDLLLPIIIVQPPFPAFSNGDFEDSLQRGWQAHSSQGAVLIVHEIYLDPVPPHSGQHAVWLGGVADEVSSISQRVAIADLYDTFTLRYWYWIASDESDCTDDRVSVRIADVEVYSHAMCRTTQTQGWQLACVPVSGWGGQAPPFQFVAQLDGSKNSHFYLDDVTRGRTCDE